MTEILVAALIASILVLTIVLTSGPRPRRAREQRAREHHRDTVHILDAFGEDADHLFR